MFVLEPRASVRLSLTLMVPVIAIILTLFIGGLIFGFLGYNPAEALYEFLSRRFLVRIKLAICW